MRDFYEKSDYCLQDIYDLITNEVEESIYLDFKDAKALDKSENKKKDISKDVASFANSDGGIIIYGIEEIDHKASKISFVDGNVYTKEWLEQIINSAIQRRIQEIQVIPIRNEGNISETIYLVKIPKSYDTPHISRDKRFYKRFNFESVIMEEYEIRQLYGQKIKSKLVLDAWTIDMIDRENTYVEKYIFTCEIKIYNDGDIPESTYKVNAYIRNFPKNLEISYPLNGAQYDHTRIEDEGIKISCSGSTTIFPGEVMNAMRFNLVVKKDMFEEIVKDLRVESRLFYSNGEDQMESSLEQFMRNIVEKKDN